MEASRPNFVFIFPDQWRGDCLGKDDNPIIETPYLDALASEGVMFNHAYAAAPSCIPARACLATGQTPSTCGRPGYRDGIPWRYEHTLMKELRDGGYHTMCVGKTHFYPQRVRLGFEELRLYDPQEKLGDVKSDYHRWLEKETNGKVKDPAIEWNNNTWMRYSWEADEYLHPTNWTTDNAIEMLENRDPHRPFFIQIGYHRPHSPYDPPKYYYDLYKDKELPPIPVGDWAKVENSREIEEVDSFRGELPAHLLDRMRRAYYGSITHIDAQIGRLIFWLKKNRLYDNTYIIFCSDHGDLMGDHLSFRKVTPMEGSARIPFIIRTPESKITGKRTLPVTHMDIMPTILEAAKLKIPKEVEGISLLSALEGKDEKTRTFIHGEHSFVSKNMVEGWQFVTDGKEKYIWESYSGKEYFFDLENDPNEMKNIIHDEKQYDKIQLWKNRMIDTLKERKEDGLVEDGKLVSGRYAPEVREYLCK